MPGQTNQGELLPSDHPLAGNFSEPSEPSGENAPQQFRHTIPWRATAQLRRPYPRCSTSLPESGSEDGAEPSSRWTPLRESTSGDSGLIGDLEFSMDDTSPDFIEKALREYHLGIHPV